MKLKLPIPGLRKKKVSKHAQTGVFISYRRSDQPGFAGRLADELETAFGQPRVFRDIESIAPGENFVEALNHSLDACAAILVIIGPGWLSEQTPEGKPRIFSPTDWVRAELQIALAKKKTVIPVLVNGATMPTEEDLPKSLHKILEFNAHEVSDKRWAYDSNSLIEELANLPGLETQESWKAENPSAGVIGALRRKSKFAWSLVGVSMLGITGIVGYTTLADSQHCKDSYKERLASYQERIENIRGAAGKDIEKSRLNDLMSSAKVAASSFKTCCIFIDKGKMEGSDYEECQQSEDDYSKKLDDLVASITEADENRVKKEGVIALMDKDVIEDSRLESIEGKLDELLGVSKELEKKVVVYEEKGSTAVAGDSASRGGQSFWSKWFKTDNGFRDDFNGALNKGAWNILEEDRSRWRFADDNYLMLVTYGPEPKNVFKFADALPEDYEATLRLETTPAETTDQSIYLALGERDSDRLDLAVWKSYAWGTRVSFAKYMDGEKSNILRNRPIDSLNNKPLYLRLRKYGFEFTAYVSLTGSDWKEIGTHVFLNFDGIPHIYVKNADKGDPETGVRVDYFEIVELQN